MTGVLCTVYGAQVYLVTSYLGLNSRSEKVKN